MSKIRIQGLVHFVPEDLSISHKQPIAAGTTRCGLSVVRHEALVAAVAQEQTGRMLTAEVIDPEEPATCIGCISQGR